MRHLLTTTFHRHNHRLPAILHHLLIRHYRAPKPPAPPKPPKPPQKPQSFTLHDATWEDPYSWMAHLNDKVAMRHMDIYMEQEEKYIEAVMSDTEKLQSKLQSEMASRLHFDLSTSPIRWGPWLYYKRVEAGKQYPVLCRRLASLNEQFISNKDPSGGFDFVSGKKIEQKLVDYNLEAERFGGYAYEELSEVSPDHKFLAYTMYDKDNDYFRLSVRNLNSGALCSKPQADRVSNLAWAKDGQALLYVVTDQHKRPCRIYCSMIGSTEEDVLLLDEPAENVYVNLRHTKDFHFVTVNTFSTTFSKAFKSAWEDACASTSPSTVLIPKGTYLLGPVIISGPCKAAIELQVKGKLQAPADMSEFEGFSSWITLNYVDQFTLTGGGTFDGQGKLASNQRICGKDKHCKLPPVSLKFNFITNGIVHDITSTDSKYFHAHLLGCKNLTFQHFTISAHDESLNTDGIHIGRSKDIKIIDSDIGTGDDCISLGHGSRQITIAGVTCAPGHGISIGSLGKSQNEESVSGVFVKNCTISNTQNGVRIKSWPALFGGSASDIHFEDIIMKNVSNPIVIDQVYCPWNECNKKSPSKVSIRNVSFKNIRGTSRTPVAVQLSCSKDIPCKEVEVADIDLRYTGSEGPAEFRCSNVQPKFLGKINPSKC